MASKKVIENVINKNETINCSDVIYINDDSDDECEINENIYDVSGDEELRGYDSDCDGRIPEDEDDEQIISDPCYDSDDDDVKTGHHLAMRYSFQHKK